MIAKISTGQGFAGATRYVLDEREKLPAERQPTLIGGNMAGENARELTREFHAVRQLRPDVDKPVYHVSLSFPRSERALGDEEMSRLAADYLQRRGFDLSRTQYVVGRHRDKPHAHCHILVNRIRTDGTLTPLQHREYLQNKDVCRELESHYKLRVVTSERRRGRDGLEERAPSRGEDRMKRDRGQESEKEQLRRVIREASADRPTMTEFLRRLERRGVQARPNVASRTGHVSGRGRACSGSREWPGTGRATCPRWSAR